MHRYPEATEVTVDVAMAALKTQSDLIDKATECSELWHGLSAAARQAAAVTEPDWATVKSLWLVADACSMMLNADSTNAPFEPFSVFDHGRSIVPEDFRRDDLTLLSEISKDVQNRMLRARLADVSWIGSRPKDVEDARRAIDAYVQELPNEENWNTALQDWRRALTLCRQLRKGADGRLEKIEQDLERFSETALQQGGGFGRAFAELLLERHLGDAGGRTIAESLAAEGEALLAQGSDAWIARASFDLAARSFTRVGDLGRAADMTVTTALSFESAADHRIANDPHTGHLVAQSFLEDAIHTLRKVPRDLRPSRSVEELLLRLSKRITDAGEKAVRSMLTIKTGATDITELVEQAVQAVSGKAPLQALIALARLHPGANLARMMQFAENSLRQFSFSRLFGLSSTSARTLIAIPHGKGHPAVSAPYSRASSKRGDRRLPHQIHARSTRTSA